MTVLAQTAAMVALLTMTSTAVANQAEIEVVVVPFTVEGVAKEEGDALALRTVKSFQASGKSTELAGVGLDQVLTLSGCDVADDACLATIPGTLGAKTVVFGTARISDGRATVVLVIVGDETKQKESITLVGATRESRVVQFGTDLDSRLGGTASTGTAPTGPTVDTEPVDDFATVERRRTTRWDRSRVKRSTWIIGGAGVGSVALGGVMLLIGNSTESDIRDAPTDTVEQLERLDDLEGRAQTLYTFGNILVVGGLVATLVGAGLGYHQGTQAASETAITVGPAVFRGGGGLSLTGTWQ